MDIDDIEAAAVGVLFSHLGINATVTNPGEAAQPSRVILDRNASVTDDYGIVIESRCEVGLKVDEVGDGSRGTLVDSGKDDDCWILLEPIGNDGCESRWTAGRHLVD